MTIRQDLQEFLIDVGSHQSARGKVAANLLYSATVQHARREFIGNKAKGWSEVNATIRELIGVVELDGATIRLTRSYSSEGLDPNKIKIINDNKPPTSTKFKGAFEAYIFDGVYTEGGKRIAVNMSIAADVKAALDELHRLGHKRAIITSGHREFDKQNQLYQDYKNGKRSLPAADPNVGNHRTGEAVDINLIWDNGRSYQENFETLKTVMRKYNLFNYLVNDPVHFSRSGN